MAVDNEPSEVDVKVDAALGDLVRCAYHDRWLRARLQIVEDCIFCVARREINALRDQGVNLLAKLRQAEDRLRWVNDHRIREFSDSELRSELARRQRMEDMLADDEMWSHS